MCEWIDKVRRLAPGWGCCKCSAYNSPLRSHCKMCSTPVCVGTLPDVVEVVVPGDVFDMLAKEPDA